MLSSLSDCKEFRSQAAAWFAAQQKGCWFFHSSASHSLLHRSDAYLNHLLNVAVHESPVESFAISMVFGSNKNFAINVLLWF